MPNKQQDPEFDVLIGSVSVRLPQREYDLLRVLQQRQGVPISAVALEREVASVYRSRQPGQGVRDLVSHLRDRLNYAGLPGHRLIRNAYGLGYYWVEPERAAETPNLRGGSPTSCLNGLRDRRERLGWWRLYLPLSLAVARL